MRVGFPGRAKGCSVKIPSSAQGRETVWWPGLRGARCKGGGLRQQVLHQSAGVCEPGGTWGEKFHVCSSLVGRGRL